MSSGDGKPAATEKIFFYDSLPAATLGAPENQIDDLARLAPSTCTEAETFALRVLDDSMEPEFRQDCIIVIDPTGHATEGSYVLARSAAVAETMQPRSGNQTDENDAVPENLLFRQLLRDSTRQWQLSPLNNAYPAESTAADLGAIVGVIVQRAGTRRRYHKRYD